MISNQVPTAQLPTNGRIGGILTVCRGIQLSCYLEIDAPSH
jgi:hypothetical protein